MLTYGHPDPFKAGPLLSLEHRKYYPGAPWAPPWRGLGRLGIHQLQMEVHASLAQYCIRLCMGTFVHLRISTRGGRGQPLPVISYVPPTLLFEIQPLICPELTKWACLAGRSLSGIHLFLPLLQLDSKYILWRDGLAFNSTYCSCRRPKFGSLC